MSDIVLTTFNARYSHTALGLRYLQANLGPLQPRSRLLEFDIHTDPAAAADQVRAENPAIVGLGMCIWNVAPATRLATLLKEARPDITLILGGPEISYETEQQEIARHADYVIASEADLAFRSLCEAVFSGHRPAAHIIRGDPPDLDRVALPYSLYTDDDIAHRTLYVETTRGCPFGCEYCLSAIEPGLRRFPLDAVLREIETLLGRGARRFKFVDRTFNVDMDRATAVLAFFRERVAPDMQVHFEMIPDRFPDDLKQAILGFPPGVLRFEVGIQTYNAEVAARIRRKTDYERADANLRFLREEAGAVVHADLIAGLPGESLESFGAGFDRLLALRPQEIQVGILKRLRGTAMDRHTREWAMVYSADPPYEILENSLISRTEMERVKRFARYWELVGNSGNFPESAPLLWKDASSPFSAFMRFSDWLHTRLGRAHAIPLDELAEQVLTYLTRELHHNAGAAAAALARDYARDGRRRRMPRALRRHTHAE